MFRSRVPTTAPVRGARLLPNPEGLPTLDLVVRRIRDEARSDGLEEGARREREAVGPLLDRITSDLDASATQALEELPRVAIQLASSIARTVLKREIASGEYDIEGMVRETLAEANVGRGTCTVHLHPTDYAQLADTRFRAGTSIQADEGVPKGDVHVETPLGLLVREALGAVDEIERRLLEDLP
ncbi:MAG TPA: hypothetical protein ENJ09_00240 [Planctomycetes bacterium]|nr:hypothetical protein [Planctomycetota bacterium]